MKGKKFDAAEKHFREKEIKFKQEINRLWERLTEISSVNSQLSKENKSLIKENSDIKQKYEKLLEYSKLSDEEIKSALDRDKSLNNLSGMLDIMRRNF